ncbi:hypothetical protein FEM48_Zijuj01G0124300 [Ziziphus jujuba var. spinosa]|uniref:Uncharacterized protein n=1 Tax=Ziziphus jujuba var. spinosa TaxID=714518 RepID=A0A978W193_ZIZJJ|nr:hypothetical protein FEM48_Zijuj01G0124300 [Ziziphus jujuba var. spinosa]
MGVAGAEEAGNRHLQEERMKKSMCPNTTAFLQRKQNNCLAEDEEGSSTGSGYYPKVPRPWINAAAWEFSHDLKCCSCSVSDAAG